MLTLPLTTEMFKTRLQVAQQCLFIHFDFFLHFPMADHKLHLGFLSLHSKTEEQ